MNQEAGQRDFRCRGICEYGGRAGLRYFCFALRAAVGVLPCPALVSVKPAGQACAVAAPGEDGGGRHRGAGGLGAFLRVGVA